MMANIRKLGLLCALLTLAGCATSLENVLSTPKVELRDMQVVGLGLKSQTFLLSFDIDNPNPFPLPISSVSYAVRLDGQRFVSGETSSEFSVPATGDAEFAISVDLNLLQTAPQLLSIIRQGVREDVAYDLEGRLAVDIPMVPPVAYRNSGKIRLRSDTFLTLRDML